MKIDLSYAPPFAPLFDDLHPQARKMFKVWRGGRGSMKSWSVGKGVVWKGYKTKRKMLCGREFQNSMADSVQALIRGQADQIGLGDHYRHTETESECLDSKSIISYKGLKQNINNLKSLEGYNLFWIEEGQTISQKSLDTILPSIRASNTEIIITYNPDAEDDPIHQFVNSLPDHLVYLCDVNWPDNPWLPESLIIQKDLRLRRIEESTNDEERAIEQEAYDQIWMGKTRKASRARIFAGKCVQQDFVVERIQGHATLADGHYINGKPADGPYYGADWGFASDPTAGVRSWICDECIYIDHELYEYRLELDKTPQALRTIPGLEKHMVRADNARPETISFCRTPRPDDTGIVQPGLNIVAVEKWPDSVEDGITILKSFKKIVMHSRCRNFWEEARYYSYKVDAKTNDVLTDVIDKYNHLWDALRYALAPFIKRSGKGQGFYHYYQQQMAKEAAPQ